MSMKELCFVFWAQERCWGTGIWSESLISLTLLSHNTAFSISLRILLSKWEKWSYVTLWARALHPIDNCHQSPRVSPHLLNHSGSPAVTWPSVAKLIAINRPSIFLPCPHPMVNLIYLERHEARAGCIYSLGKGWFIRALGFWVIIDSFSSFCAHPSFFPPDAGSGIQVLTNASQVLCHWATLSVQHLLVLATSSLLFFKKCFFIGYKWIQHSLDRIM